MIAACGPDEDDFCDETTGTCADDGTEEVEEM